MSDLLYNGLIDLLYNDMNKLLLKAEKPVTFSVTVINFSNCVEWRI